MLHQLGKMNKSLEYEIHAAGENWRTRKKLCSMTQGLL